MRHVAETTGQDLEQLYKQIAWPMYKMYGHAFEAFKTMVQDPEPVFTKLQVLLLACHSIHLSALSHCFPAACICVDLSAFRDSADYACQTSCYRLSFVSLIMAVLYSQLCSATVKLSMLLLQEANGGEPLSVLTDAVRSGLMKNITRRMTPQPLKIRADVDMTCFAYDGVLHIQASLRPAAYFVHAVHLSGCTDHNACQ